MNKCQFCGADETEIDYKFSVYECGTTWRVGEHVTQSTVCRELCDLRKWREVVLKNVEPETLMRYSTGEFIACCKVSIGKTDTKDAKKAFDYAVRKEME